jgi:hypothetical protein
MPTLRQARSTVKPASRADWTSLRIELTAHTLCIDLNRLLGNPHWLRIKALAFPI